MDIVKYRPLFNIYIIDESSDRREVLCEILSDAGFDTENVFTTSEAALTALSDSPPHVVVYVLKEDPSPKDILDDGNFVRELLERVPESHVIAVCSQDDLEYGLAYYDKGVFDVLGLPLESEVQLVQAIDRAIRLDYYTYLNEQLKEEQLEATKPSSKSDLVKLTYLHQWSKKLYQTTALSEVAPILCDDLHRHSSGRDVIFFKYIESRGTLVASYSSGRPFATIRGIGINLIESSENFFQDQLFLPNSIQPLKELLNDVFEVEEFCVQSFVQMGEVKGVVAVLGVSQDFAADEYVKFVFSLSEKHLNSLESNRQIQRLNKKDKTTDFLLRPHFLEKMRAEISRSRRVQLPISLLVFDFEVHLKPDKTYQDGDLKLIMKMVSSIFTENCRVYDLFGRMADRQVALLLPHVKKRDAALKGETLRRVLESANFSDVVPAVDRVTAYVGVSEYPTLSGDAEEMLLAADDALSVVSGSDEGKVCVARAKEGFVPDFFVVES